MIIKKVNKEKSNVSNIYTKKLTVQEQKIIPLNNSHPSLNTTKFFPSMVREWYDNIYSFKNANSSFILNRDLNSLIKGYFYMFYKKNIMDIKNKSIRLRRLSLKRIFVSKMYLKQTSQKVNINISVYNEEKRVLIKSLGRITSLILSTNSLYLKSRKKKNFVVPILRKIQILNKDKKQASLLEYLKAIRNNIIISLKEQNKINNNSNSSIKKLNNVYINKLLLSLHTISNIMILCNSDKIFYQKYDTLYKKFLTKIYLEKEIKLLNYYKLLLIFNNNKFKDNFLNKLGILLSKLFNKEVNFNIINQKYIHLNSDIFTEAITIKLRKRKNRLLRTLKNFLKTVKIPKVNKLETKHDYFNRLSINKVNNFMHKNLYDKDLLHNLLREKVIFYPNTRIRKNMENQIVDSLKYKQMVGIRLEAKGRLTKRFTASRSVFKLRWKGSIRNIDSSYKGFSSVLLRGHLTPNLQYSLVNSTTRNGAFGIKGWISGN